MSPEPQAREVCYHCLHGELQASEDPAAAQRAWCHRWDIAIPDATVVGCLEFKPRTAAAPVEDSTAAPPPEVNE